MAFWKSVAIFAVGSLIHKARKRAQEEAEERERRINAWNGFTGDISEYDFSEMVRHAKRGIRRLKSLTIEGPVVYGAVRTQSGLSEWHFKADFNDYGRLSGTYWLSSDNDDSSIPERVADIISSSIKNFHPDPEFDDFNCYITDNGNRYRNRRRRKNEHEEKNSDRHSLIALMLIFCFCVGTMYYFDYVEKQGHRINNEVQISASAKELKNESAENVLKIFEHCGFKNVGMVNKGDLVFGLISKEGQIESISINGSSDFSKGDWFPADAIVIITYHGFPQNSYVKKRP